MSHIEDIKALEVLDSRGNPTVEVAVFTQDGIFTAIVPSGASTGSHEAVEKRDGGKRYLGKGVKKVVRTVEKVIGPKLYGADLFVQRDIDAILKDIDGTEYKNRYGANALLGVSLACARAGASSHGLSLFEYIYQLVDEEKKMKLPTLYMNVINGGKHAANKLAFQEFMIVPEGKNFAESLRIGSEVYHVLGDLIEKKYATRAIGDEGGYAPKIKSAEEALELLKKAIRKAGYSRKVGIAVDAAASEFHIRNKKESYYQLHKKMTPAQLKEYYLKLIKKYKIVSLEDPFEDKDFATFAELRKEARKLKCQIVADDLTVSNVHRLEKAIDFKSANCLLLKVNQIGTLTEALNAVRMAYDNNWKVMVSHRSGESEDTFIADLAVGIGCGMIKSGAPARGERTAKYNRLLKIYKFGREEKLL